MVRAEPAPAIRTLVAGYCGYTEHTRLPLRRLELPGARVVLILNLGEPLRLFDPRDRGGGPRRMGSFVAGLSDSYALTETGGTQRGLQVEFTPLGASMFLGVPMEAIANTAVGLDEVLGQEADRTIGRLSEARSWEARFDVMDAVIIDRFSKGRPPSAEVAWAWNRLSATNGRIRVDALATEVGWSRRHLAARFRRNVGLTPKLVARILRFRRAVGLLERFGTFSLADIVEDSVYFELAHLDRVFRQFAGVSPVGLRGRLLPDGGGLSGA